MPLQDSQEAWDEYYQRKKAERLHEAAVLDLSMRSAGVTDETALAIDFVHFSSSRPNIEMLAEQLSENYTIEVVQTDDQDAWLARGTTRPYGINLSQEQHLTWVGFMADVAASCACVFSTWLIEAPSLKLSFNSEHIDGERQR